jgi:hypothetical protein
MNHKNAVVQNRMFEILNSVKSVTSKSLWQCYLNIIIVFLGIVHHPIFFIYNNVSETEFCLRLQVETYSVLPQSIHPNFCWCWCS